MLEPRKRKMITKEIKKSFWTAKTFERASLVLYTVPFRQMLSSFIAFIYEILTLKKAYLTKTLV